MSTPGPKPGPMPGPVSPGGPDLDELRSVVGELLEDSAPAGDRVTDEQVAALDRANAVLAEALESLDRGR